MKYFSIVSTSLLAIAVATLFYLHFDKNNNHQTSSKQHAELAKGFKIAYFEMDSLENNYELMKKVREELKQREQELTKELRNLANLIEQKGAELQRKGEQNITQADMEEYDRLRRALQEKENANSMTLKNEIFTKMQSVKKQIQDYLKTYNNNKGYAYIFASMGDDNLMYYTDTIYNITNDLIKELNASYKK
jgi:outer membrane protein